MISEQNILQSPSWISTEIKAFVFFHIHANNPQVSGIYRTLEKMVNWAEQGDQN